MKYHLEQYTKKEIQNILDNNFEIIFEKSLNNKILERFSVKFSNNSFKIFFLNIDLENRKERYSNVSLDKIFKYVLEYKEQVDLFKKNNGFYFFQNKKYEMVKFDLYYKKRKIEKNIINKLEKINKIKIIEDELKNIELRKYSKYTNKIFRNKNIKNIKVNYILSNEKYVECFIVLNEYNETRMKKMYFLLKVYFHQVNFIIQNKFVLKKSNEYNVFCINQNNITLINYVENRRNIEKKDFLLNSLNEKKMREREEE